MLDQERQEIDRREKLVIGLEAWVCFGPLVIDQPVVITPSMRIALADLKLDELRVVYPGAKRYPLAKNVEVVPLVELVNAK